MSPSDGRPLHLRTASLLIRLRVDAAAEGRIVGDVEDVDTGQVDLVHDLDSLGVVVRRLAGQRAAVVDPVRRARQSEV